MKRSAQILNLGAIHDDWLLGVLCEKAGIVEYAMKNLEIMDSEDRTRLFEQGRKCAENFKLEDIADELWIVRRHTPRLFDVLVCRGCGSCMMHTIRTVIKNRSRLERKQHEIVVMDIMNRLYPEHNFSRTTYPQEEADGDNRGMAATVVEGTARKQVLRKCANQTQKPVQR